MKNTSKRQAGAPQYNRFLSMCAEDAPQFSNDITNQSKGNLRPECGANAPTFLSDVYTNSTQAKKRQAGAPQYGRSMIEMLGVLAIIGILSVGGIAGYSSAMYKNKLNKVKEQVAIIATNIQRAYISQANYNDLDNERAIALGFVPPEMIDDDGSITDALGGKVTISSTNAATGAICEGTDEDPCNSFVIVIDKLSRKQTLDLATHSWLDLNILGVFIDESEE